MRSRLRRYFIAGLIVFLPVAVTITVILWLFRVLDGFLGWLFTLLLGRPIPGLGLIASVLVILVLGALATNVLGRRLVELFERVILSIPLARSIYSATKSISDSIFLQRKAAFQRPVLIQWPREGMYTIGFVTGESQDPARGRRVLSVFVMTTPNPTSGFLMLVPDDEATPLEMSVEDALKVMISGGIVSPNPAQLRGAIAASERAAKPGRGVGA